MELVFSIVIGVWLVFTGIMYKINTEKEFDKYGVDYKNAKK